MKHGSPDASSRGGVLKIDYQTKHFSLPRPLPYTQPCLEQLKYGRFIRIETYANGGATVVHMYQDEIDCLNKEEMDELVQEYFKVSDQYTAHCNPQKCINQACFIKRNFLNISKSLLINLQSETIRYWYIYHNSHQRNNEICTLVMAVRFICRYYHCVSVYSSIIPIILLFQVHE